VAETVFVVVFGMALPLVALGVVCWIFYRAKRREDAALARRDEWRNTRSS
jgi:hypothetical protein